MTIGQRRQHKGVSVQKSFMISDKQKTKMHEAAQMHLFQMSDVKGELHKKQQQAASREHRASIRGQRTLCAEANDQPRIRYRWKNKTVEEKAIAGQKILFDTELVREGGNANGECDRLLVLANSAELLESEGQCLMEIPLDATQGNGDMVVEIDTLHVQRRLRLTQIRHQARLASPHPIQETHVNISHEHADHTMLEDTNNGKSLDADQVQGATDHHDVQDPYLGAKRGSKGAEDIGKQASLEETKITNEKLQQPSVEPQSVIPQPVQMTTEGRDLTEQRSDEYRLTQVKTTKRNGSLEEHHLNSLPLNYHIKQPVSLVQMLQAPKDHHFVARQRRMLRTFERRKQRYGAHFQWMANTRMRQRFEAQQQWLWHVMNVQKEQNHIAKQQRSLNTSNMQRDQKRMAAQQRRAWKIEEERAFKKVYQQLKSPLAMKHNHLEEGFQNPNASTGVKQNVVPVEINQSFQHPTIAKICEDKCGDLHQPTTNVEGEKKASSIAGQMRLIHLKRKARMKDLNPVERKYGEEISRQNDKGDESRRC